MKLFRSALLSWFLQCGGERRAKTTPTLSGTGHPFQPAQIRFYSLHRRQIVFISM